MGRFRIGGTALITGASSGLGEEYALQLAGRCGRLVLTARRESLLDALADRLRATHPQLEVRVLAADLADEGAREDFVSAVLAAGWVPDLLVNNAGLGDYGEFAGGSWERTDAMLRVNIGALTHLTHAFVPAMAARGGGAVMNVSSLASLLPIPDFAVYAATKAYVTSLSEALRIEFSGLGIAVIAVCPGPVPTGFGEVARREPGARLPVSEWVLMTRERVVGESLGALVRGKARVYPGKRTRLAARFISLLPLAWLRAAMSTRPRRS